MKTLKSKKSMMAVAMVLMVALVIGMGAMTYSRYITTAGDKTLQATAAKWGYVVTVSVDDMFGSTYKADDSVNGTSVTTATDAESFDVVAEIGSSNLILAPGTKGSMTINVVGEAEVLAELTISVKGVTDGEDAQEIHLGDYYPIVWSISDGTTTTTGSLDEIVTALQGGSAIINPGSAVDKNYTLSWSWAEETGTTDEEKAENNKNDTIIGYLSAGKTIDEINAVYGENTITDATEYSTSINMVVSVSVEQIQQRP